MKLAILLLCHKNPKQINLFLETLQHPDIEFFIHVDKKANITKNILARNDVHILSDEYRVDVQWGEFSQTRATLNLIYFARDACNADYYWLCSGQDFPIHSAEYILDFLSHDKDANYMQFWSSVSNGAAHENNLDKRNVVYYPHWIMGRSFYKRLIKRAYVCMTGGYNCTFKIFRRKDGLAKIHKYFGSNWMCMTQNFIDWFRKYLQENKWYEKDFVHSLNPDECFFQTLLMLSPYRDTRHDYLHYIDWSTPRKGNPKNSPNTLLMEDYDKITSSPYLMARKFDIQVDPKIIELLQRDIFRCRL